MNKGTHQENKWHKGNEGQLVGQWEMPDGNAAELQAAEGSDPNPAAGSGAMTHRA